jgi:large conductance mechanosensitive channel
MRFATRLRFRSRLDPAYRSGAVVRHRRRERAVSNLWSDFKKFVMQGDLVAVAVAFIIGLAFKTVVDSLVNDVVMPIIGAVFGKPSFDDLTLKIGDGVVFYGRFINALINFAIIAATLFVIVRVYEAMKARRSPAEKAEDPTELDVLTEIRDLLASRS